MIFGGPYNPAHQTTEAERIATWIVWGVLLAAAVVGSVIYRWKKDWLTEWPELFGRMVGRLFRR